MGITTRAAVIREPNQWWQIEELELDDPKAGEVLIRFEASGLCHSDDHVRTGDARNRFPMVGGHEGSGVIEAIGANVTRAKVGEGRAVRMAKQIQAGQVAVNAAGAFGVIGAPFGGYRSSGFGRTMGADAVLYYTQIKTVAIEASP